MKLNVISAIAGLFGLSRPHQTHQALPPFRDERRPMRKVIDAVRRIAEPVTERPALVVYAIEKATPCGRHYWLSTNFGRIRKPAGTFPVPAE